MKILEEKPNIETSGSMDEQFFSIQDQGMIFDILRNRMYSDPILAICREISCNARDAHREAGNNELPVEITLPTALEPFYKIKDFGPGINPDRMSNVFIKYTASTKRQDNIQTGGFGLGAKTPFSYSDTFTIVTVVSNIKYNYACFIDETKVGKLILMDESVCNERNSTEIIIPVKSADFKRFSVATESAIKHWQIKPIIKNGDINWTRYKVTIEGSNWKICTTEQSHYYTYDRGVKILVDDIEYSLATEAIAKFANFAIVEACKGILFLKFNIGELSLSASRESLYIDKPTEIKIKERLELVEKEITNQINNKISNFSNYLEANSFITNKISPMFNNINFFGSLNWNNIPLYGKNLGLKTPIIYFFKSDFKSKKIKSDYIRIRSKASYHLNLDQENTHILYNDLDVKNITSKYVKKAFEDGAETVQVINAYKGDSLKITNINPIDLYNDLDKKYSLTGLGCQKLSSIFSGSIKNKAVSINKFLLFKLSANYAGFSQVPLSSLKEDNNKIKIYCFFKKSNSNHYGKQTKEVLYNNAVLNYEYIRNLLIQFKDISIYSIDQNSDLGRIKKLLKGFVSIEDFVKDNIINSNIDYVKIKAFNKMNSYSSPHSFTNDYEFIKKIKNLIKDKNSLYLKKINALEIMNVFRKNTNCIDFYEYATSIITEVQINDWLKNNPDYNVKNLLNQCKEKYPLLNNISYYAVEAEHVAQYVNCIDSL